MNFLILNIHSLKITAFSALFIFVGSCKKEMVKQQVYTQKEVTIEYKISPYK